MQIYTLKIVYDSENNEIYEISEEIQEENLGLSAGKIDLIDEEDILEAIALDTMEVAIT
jgi:hypothetical protein|tara:strand:+ start:376 stop:552 length:177 start_codon:yes stop_codon:yes gene_type:complete